MAAWPPAIGTKWRDTSPGNPIWRTVLWRDDRSVQVKSEWKIKSGGKTDYTRTLSRREWETWEASPVEVFK